MKRYALLIALLILPALAGVVTQTVRFSENDIVLTQTDGYDVIDLRGYPALINPGEPRLPRVVQTLAIPAGANPTGVELTAEEWTNLPGTFNVLPAQPDVPLPMPGMTYERKDYPADPAVYASSEYYPRAVLRLLETGTMAGYRMAHVEVLPVRYIPTTGRLQLATSLSYRLTYAGSDGTGFVPTRRQREIFGDAVRALVVNPNSVRGFAPAIGRVGQTVAALPSGSFDYVTISRSPVDTIFQRLARWHTRKGLHDTVITIPYIIANYTGTDSAAKVRAFIQDAYSTWGVNYVLLGGSGDYKSSGQNIVPTRKCYYIRSGVGSYADEDSMPCDLYYAGLDGSWNADGDRIYGERTDAADMYGEVYVGRASVYTIAQAQNFVYKVMTYEKAPPTTHLKKLMLPTGILWTSYNERPMQDSIARMTPSGWFDAKMHERTSNLSQARMIESLNTGYGLGHWVGHGNQDGIYYNGGSSPFLTSANADALTNGDKTHINVSIACFTGAWDEKPGGGDCFAEHLVNRVGGGTVATIMNSRYGWGAYTTQYVPGPSERLDTTWFANVLNQNRYRAGHALIQAKAAWVPYADSTGKYDMQRWCIYELNLFGDPALPVWTDVPTALTGSFTSPISTGSQSFPVTITQGGNPVNGATVVLWKGGEVYTQGTTNSSGQVTLSINPTTAGWMYVTAIARDELPLTDSCQVTLAASDDVGCTRIVVPTGTLDSGTTTTPACTVYNYGTSTETYTVRMKIGALYNQTATVTSHAPGTKVRVTFANWTALPRGALAVTCSTQLTGDAAPGNDKAAGSVTVQVKDAQTVSIDAPVGTVNQGTVITPRATVRNNGNTSQTFNILFTIAGGYSNTQSVTVAAGTSQQVAFSNWTASGSGTLATSCTTQLAGDVLPANDKLTGSVFVQVLDAQTVSIDAPTGTVSQGAVVTPRASVRNNGNTSQTFSVKFSITPGYADSQSVTLAAGASQQLAFANWTAGPIGTQTTTCSTRLVGDLTLTNDKVTSSVMVEGTDAQTLSIAAPTGTVNLNSTIAPQATVRNNSSASQTFNVVFKIGGSYSNTQSVTLAAGASTQVTFANWTATPTGSQAVQCSTALSGDQVPANNKLTGTVFVQSLDAQAVSIIAPTGTVTNGTVITPQASVRNNGNTTQTFSVTFTITGGYSNTQGITLAAGATQTVNFSNWTAGPNGALVTRCTTLLGGDMSPANDVVSGSVTVQNTDAQTVSINAPTGTVTPGAVVAPLATVRNNSSASKTFTVKFTIATGYADSQSVTLAAGAQTQLTFANWTAGASGTYATKCSTRLAGDLNPGNDAISGTVTVQGLDAQVVSITAPAATVTYNNSYTPAATVRNNGTSTVTFPVTFTISTGYTNTQTVTLAAGASQSVSFASWTATPPGPVTTRCSTGLSGDGTPVNDTLSGSTRVQYPGRDAQTVSIDFPTGTVDQGSIITPRATIRNNGNSTRTISAKFDISDGYTSTVSVSLAPGASAQYTFASWTANTAGTLTIKCSTRLTLDGYRANDKLTGTVFVQTLDAQTVSIDAPTGTVMPGTIIAPRATVRNNGNTSQTFSVLFTIAGGYSNTQTVTLAAGASGQVTFSNWTANPTGTLTTACSTQLSGDMTPANDRLTGLVTVQGVDAQTVSIDAPAGTVNQGSVVQPQATVRNNSTTSQTFTVKFTVTPGYADSQSVTLAAGATQQVTFANWTASPTGSQAVSCSTRLAGDVVPANDKLTGTVLVQNLDAQTVSIIAPTGTVNQGAVITPQASIRNNGNTSQTFNVRFTIAGGYSNVQSVTLAAGATQTVSFVNWTASTLGTLATQCSTQLAGDLTPGNNRVTGTVFVQSLDAAPVSIDVPTGTVSQGTVLTPRVTVRNNGNTSQTFSVLLTITGGYSNSQSITLAAGATQQVAFTNWTAGPTGTQTVKCSTQLASDMTPANDKLTGSVLVQTLDAQSISIDAPTGTVNQGSVIAPMATVRNNGNTSQTFSVLLTITGGYSNTQTVTLTPGASHQVTFTNWTASTAGTQTVKCSTQLAGDMTPANDKLTGTVLVQTLDAQTVSVDAPTGTVHQGTVITPRATVKNNGNTSQTFNVSFAITGGYVNTQSVTLAPGASQQVTFTNWTAGPTGTLTTKCTTQLAGDMSPANDKLTGAVTVQALDVGTTVLLAPAGGLDSGASVTPACTVYNYGNTSQTYAVRMQVGTTYDQVMTVAGHAAGAKRYVTFPAWTALERGTLPVVCSTELAGDMTPGNDARTGSVIVRVRDAGTQVIILPAQIDSGASVTPACTVYNYGNTSEDYQLRFAIGIFYNQSVAVLGHNPGTARYVTFPAWTADQPGGTYPVVCTTEVTGDMVTSNDAVHGSLEVIAQARDTGWAARPDVPTGARSRKVRDGGRLAYDERTVADIVNGYVYALKGNSTCEFYAFNTTDNTWGTLDSVPALGSSGRVKAVRDGSALTVHDHLVYAAKGNTTCEFWRYDGSAWTELASIPLGLKTVREGTGAAPVTEGDSTCIYFLKGSMTAEFYRYNILNNTWEAMPDAPLGVSGKTFRAGSALAGDNDRTLYALKGNYNEFYAYDVVNRTWTECAGLPLIGASGRKKSARDGASLAFYDGQIYAFKGGNTFEFWRYSVAADSWVQYPDIPAGVSGRRVRAGGSLVYGTRPYPGLYALKGNSTYDFWRYGFETDQPQASSSKLQASEQAQTSGAHIALRVNPNPLLHAATISYTLPVAGRATLRLFDATGRQVTKLADAYRAAGAYTLPLARARLARGVYVLRLETAAGVVTNRLVVE